MKPTVSVIIPTYNRADYIFYAVAFALSQKDVQTEIIVVDDASTDETSKIMKRIKASMPQVRYIRHSKNKGVSAARNTGIKQAKGDYIAFLDSDDQWDSHKLAKQYDDLRSCPYPADRVFSLSYYENLARNGDRTVDGIFVENDQLDEKGDFKNIRKYDEQQIEGGVITGLLWFGIGSTLFAHRDAIRKNGMFDETMGCAEDTEYVMRHLVKGGKIRVVPAFLMSYLLPERGKIYPGQDTYQHYMIEKYKCRVAQGWGPAAAQIFIKRLQRFYMARRDPLKSSWTEAANEILPIPSKAPCRKNFDCALKGTICREEPKPEGS